MAIKLITLGLGANVGNTAATLALARAALQDRIGPIVAASKIEKTLAWGVTDQPNFLNQVVVLYPTRPAIRALDPASPVSLHQVLDITQGIENELGRVRSERWGPRTCDIDLIFIDRLVVETDRLTIPHPYWNQRPFVGGLIARDIRWLQPVQPAPYKPGNNA